MTLKIKNGMATTDTLTDTTLQSGIQDIEVVTVVEVVVEVVVGAVTEVTRTFDLAAEPVEGVEEPIKQ
jgi:hypothetical protein